ncbi:keratin-associated protein 5-4-like [Vigna unguiculata]|uniref:keratin-associated protein 5-4-like n=1 Tax=Vigna unguiculata TaxID=3917 RepID=UPI001016C32E|nr:keratin-associated protein 5-4-like [Vigna unguiculata]
MHLCGMRRGLRVTVFIVVGFTFPLLLVFLSLSYMCKCDVLMKGYGVLTMSDENPIPFGGGDLGYGGGGGGSGGCGVSGGCGGCGGGDGSGAGGSDSGGDDGGGNSGCADVCGGSGSNVVRPVAICDYYESVTISVTICN